MKILEKIKSPIKKEMDLFEEKFSSSMISDVPLLNRITHYVVKRKGKQMRPMFVFLTAKMMSNNGCVNEKVFRAASIIELIHTATLIHDDVVDSSDKRRGFFSLNALWKNKIAVLVGDFLLSKGMLLCIDNDDFDLLKIISKSVKDMSQGELLQIEKARRLDIDEETYFNIITKKTASLIASCCALGAAASNSSKIQINKLYELGEKIGVAFQLKDDLFDYGTKKIGKPTGIDIKEKKLTLPLIYALNNSSESKKKWLINSVKNGNDNAIKDIIDYVTEIGGIDYTQKKIKEYYNSAIEDLKYFEDNEFKETPTSSIYVIGLKCDYKEDTATDQQKKFNKIDLVRYHVLKEDNHASTEIIHGSDRQFYNFVKLGKKGLKAYTPCKRVYLDYYEKLTTNKDRVSDLLSKPLAGYF